MEKASAKSGDAFRLRLWRSQAVESWRGQIVHVESGEAVAFGSDEALLAYMQSLFSALADKPDRPGLK